MWWTIGLLIFVGIISFAGLAYEIGYKAGVDNCTKKLEKELKEMKKDYPDDYTYGY